jgi:hypothetical protein
VSRRAEEGRVQSNRIGCDHLEFLEHSFKLQDSQVISSPKLDSAPRSILRGVYERPTCGNQQYCSPPRWRSPHRRCTSSWTVRSRSASTRNCPRTHWLLVRYAFTASTLYSEVTGKRRKSRELTRPGHYHAEAWDDATKTYQTKPDVGVFVTVEETFDNNHRIVAQRGSSEGRFTFSAADSGQHRICVTPQNVPSGGGWLGTGVHGTVKFTLDMAIGETSRIESTDKDKVETLVQKVKDLNSRLQDVRREQVFQRVR